MHAKRNVCRACFLVRGLSTSKSGFVSPKQKYFIHGPTHPRLPPVHGQGCVIPNTVALSPKSLLATKFSI